MKNIVTRELDECAGGSAGVAGLIPDHQLLRRIGRGSYGEVWLARSVTGVWRAVKIVRRDAFAEERPFEREFEGIRTFQAVARGHEALINLLHVGRPEGADFYYYVMELATYAVGEGYEIFFKVMRAGRIDLAGQVAVVVGNSNGDVLLSQQRFEFAPGEFEKEVRIFIVDDLLHEGTETIRLSLKPEDGISTTGASSEIDLVIADNDAPPKVSVQDATVTEADDVAVNLYFNFTLSAPSALQVKVLGISTANLTATNADYGAISVPELIFEPGETSKEVRVIVAGDWLDEFPEQFHLDIASANGATLERNRAVGTILDNDLTLREYRNWLPGYFPPGERSDNTRVSPCADPDRDGMSNAIEFILGSDPRNAASGPERMSLVVTGGFVVWQAVVPISRAADLGLYVEESDDLASWTGPASSLTAEAAGVANVRLIWRHPLTTPRKFLRLGAPCPPFAPEP